MDTIPVKHHPDIRWVVVVTIIITALLVGGVIIYISTNKRETALEDTTALEAQKFGALQKEVENLKKINENLQLELKAKTIIPPATDGGIAVNATWTRFTSKHGFMFNYEKNWLLSDTTIEKYATIAAAEKESGNHVAVEYLGPLNTPVSAKGFAKNQVKAELWVYENFGKTLDQWLSGMTDILEKTTYDTPEARSVAKVIFKGTMGSEKDLSYFYVEGKKAVRFNVYPENSDWLKQAEAVVNSFKF